MRKGLTFEAARQQHRTRGRWLIFAGIAALAIGVTLSFVVSSAWGADRQDAAQVRFDDTVTSGRMSVEDTVRTYRRMLTVTRGFLEVADPTPAQFAKFSDSLELTDAHPAVIGLEFIERRPLGSQVALLAHPLRAIVDLVTLRKLDWQGLPWLTQGLRIEEAQLRTITRLQVQTLLTVYKQKRPREFLRTLAQEMHID